MTYSNSLALSRQHYSSRQQNTVDFRPKQRRIGPVSNTVVLIVLACLLGLLYLAQVTKTNAYGFTINNLKDKQSQLQTEHDNLQVASARLRSLDRTQSSQVASNMQPIVPSGTVTR